MKPPPNLLLSKRQKQLVRDSFESIETQRCHKSRSTRNNRDLQHHHRGAISLDSFESIETYGTSVVVLFYGRLFETAPETRALFKIDIREQSRKLEDTLRTTVEALDNF